MKKSVPNSAGADHIDISYKTIERLYSDDEVITAIHNLHVLILKTRI